MLFDPGKKYFALIHGSTISLGKNIIPKTLHCLRKWAKVDLKQTLCYIGPGICSQCYKYKIDLKQTAREELIFNGLAENNIVISRYCTCHDTDFFYSNQRAKNKAAEGRQIAIIGRREKT